MAEAAADIENTIVSLFSASPDGDGLGDLRVSLRELRRRIEEDGPSMSHKEEEEEGGVAAESATEESVFRG